MSELTHAEFSQTSPLTFSFYNFYDPNDRNLLYINDDPSNLKFNLEIKNQWSETISLDPELDRGRPPNCDNFHIELKFRPNELSDLSHEQIDLDENSKDEWSMSRAIPNRDRTISLYFLKRGKKLILEANNSNGEPNPKQIHHLTLLGISANSIAGARATQVEINYQGLNLAQKKNNDSTQSPNISKQTQLLILTIINHSGQRAASLVVCLAESPIVLNETKAKNQSLKIQIVNVGTEPIALNNDSRFEITIDVDSTSLNAKDIKEPWALSRKDEAQAIKASNIHIEQNEWKGKSKKWQDYWEISEPNFQAEDPVWTIKPKSAQQTALTPNDDIFIVLENFSTSLPSGVGNLYVAYYNLPGYRDKKHTLGIYKTCVTEKNGRIGIGKFADTNQEDLRLDVNGAIASHSLKVQETIISNSLLVTETVTAGKFEGEGAFVKGMIIMWSGNAYEMPKGWLLCDGSNGTPNLTDRFIMGAGGNCYPNQYGEADSHVHTINPPNITLNINSGGGHTHGFPARWYNRNFKSDDKGSNGIDIRGENIETVSTRWDGDHNHTGMVNIERFDSASNAGKNRPKWYALCFIIKN